VRANNVRVLPVSWFYSKDSERHLTEKEGP
jgi:hypothetical protein